MDSLRYHFMMMVVTLFFFGLVGSAVVDNLIGYASCASDCGGSVLFWHFLFQGFRYIFWAGSLLYVYRLVKDIVDEKPDKPIELGGLRY